MYVYIYIIYILVSFQKQNRARQSRHQATMSISSGSSSSTTAANLSSSQARAPSALKVVDNETQSNHSNNVQQQKSLANKMRGIGKRISRFRSRSAERVSQRNRTASPEHHGVEIESDKHDASRIYHQSKNTDDAGGEHGGEIHKQDQTSGNRTIITFR